MCMEKVQLFFEKFAQTECKGVDKLYNQYSENKDGLIKFLGAEKIQKKVTYRVKDEDVEEMRNEFLKGNVYYHIPSQVRDFLSECSASEIIDNKCMGTHGYTRVIMNHTPNYKEGMKLSKVLSNWVGEDANANFTEVNGRNISKKEWFEIEYSKFRQSLKGSGYLVLSAEALDFLTMSYNRSGWKSCHRPEGEYRTGCVSYMTDQVTLVAYFHDGKQVEYFDGFEHNSKSWRQMIWVDLDKMGAVFSRQYPGKNPELSRIVREWVGDLFAQRFNVPKKWVVENGDETCKNDMKDAVNLHYNDPIQGHSDCVHMNMWNPMDSAECEYSADGIKIKQLDITVGNSPVCPVCGEGNLELQFLLKCHNCDGSVICGECGVHTLPQSQMQHNGRTLCSRCYNNQFAPCNECGVVHERDILINLRGYGRVCPTCARNSNVCSHCGSTVRHTWLTTNGGSVCEDCRRSYYSRCDLCRGYTPDEEHRDNDGLCNECYAERQERHAQNVRAVRRAM